MPLTTQHRKRIRASRQQTYRKLRFIYSSNLSFVAIAPTNCAMSFGKEIGELVGKLVGENIKIKEVSLV